MKNIFDYMHEIRFFDVDPDSGAIVQDKLIARTEDLKSGKWVIEALYNINEEPNREFYLTGTEDEIGSFQERVQWVYNSYHLGKLDMESLPEMTSIEDFDKIKSKNGSVGVPVFRKYLVTQ